MSYWTIALVGVIVVALLLLAWRYDPISRAEREERRFQRWKRDLDRRQRQDDDPSPDDE